MNLFFERGVASRAAPLSSFKIAIFETFSELEEVNRSIIATCYLCEASFPSPSLKNETMIALARSILFWFGIWFFQD
jgi:hypothetical protein